MNALFKELLDPTHTFVGAVCALLSNVQHLRDNSKEVFLGEQGLVGKRLDLGFKTH